MVNLAIPAKVYKDVGIAFHPPFGAKTYVTLDPVAWRASFDPPSPPPPHSACQAFYVSHCCSLTTYKTSNFKIILLDISCDFGSILKKYLQPLLPKSWIKYIFLDDKKKEDVYFKAYTKKIKVSEYIIWEFVLFRHHCNIRYLETVSFPHSLDEIWPPKCNRYSSPSKSNCRGRQRPFPNRCNSQKPSRDHTWFEREWRRWKCRATATSIREFPFERQPATVCSIGSKPWSNRLLRRPSLEEYQTSYLEK